jgi:hypothetical protein
MTPGFARTLSGHRGRSSNVVISLLLLMLLAVCRVNHGVQTMYEFAEEAGCMERSRYFGFSKGVQALLVTVGLAIVEPCIAIVQQCIAVYIYTYVLVFSSFIRFLFLKPCMQLYCS